MVGAVAVIVHAGMRALIFVPSCAGPTTASFAVLIVFSRLSCSVLYHLFLCARFGLLVAFCAALWALFCY